MNYGDSNRINCHLHLNYGDSNRINCHRRRHPLASRDGQDRSYRRAGAAASRDAAGYRREQVFFSDDDYLAYVDLLADALETSASQIWAWCLMPNHVHLIVVPCDEDGIRATVANAHRRYAARVNARNRWTGHFWQGRYGSVAMDEAHLHNALAYVTLNPVRAGLVERAEQWRWSSVHAHLAGRDDAITTVGPGLSRVGDFAAFLGRQYDDEAFDPIRRAEQIGRPIGSTDFIVGLEAKLGRQLMPGKRGRKAAAVD